MAATQQEIVSDQQMSLLLSGTMDPWLQVDRHTWPAEACARVPSILDRSQCSDIQDTEQGTLLCLSERPQMLFYSSFLLEELLICFQGNNICSLNMDCSIFCLLLSATVSSWGSIFILKALKKLSSVGNLDCHKVCNFNLRKKKLAFNNINIAFINKVVHHTYRFYHVK